MFGWFTRHIWQIVTGIVVLVVYGGILWGAVPGSTVAAGCPGRAICAVRIAGVLAAYWLSGPERKAREQARRPGSCPGLTS